MATEYRFRVEDYAVLAAIMLISMAVGLSSSVFRHKQSSMFEYFLAGKNMPLTFVVLSYFSSYAAGGMTGLAIETYAFGAQCALSIVVAIPICSLLLNYLVVPVFYRLQNISLIKYFEIRFGATVGNLTLTASIFQMTAIGTVNIFVAAVAIQQVSALSFWTATAIMSTVCILYSTLGGMRGIVLADAIQAIVMAIAILFALVMGVVRAGGPKAIWDISSQYDRLSLDWRLDPTIRHTVFSSSFGLPFLYLGYLVTGQALMQRCLMAPNLTAAKKVAVIGSTMTYVYMLVFQAFGLVIFGYYKGCNLVKSGSINNVNQLISYFAMEILHEYPALPGVFFSGTLCATLSTISSILNSISAVIMSRFTEKFPTCSNKTVTLLCKLLVVASGGIMVLCVALVNNFHNFNQAGAAFIAVTAGPTLALYFLGILCPQANHKCAAISYSLSILFGLWVTVGTMATPTTDVTLPFANCTSSSNATYALTSPSSVNITDTEYQSTWNSGLYFPLSNVSYSYMTLEGFIVTVVCFIILTICFGGQPGQDGQPEKELSVQLIPMCIQRFHTRLSKRMRQLLLCDIYDDVTMETKQQLVQMKS